MGNIQIQSGRGMTTKSDFCNVSHDGKTMKIKNKKLKKIIIEGKTCDIQVPFGSKFVRGLNWLNHFQSIIILLCGATFAVIWFLNV
jgi:hypothetical protein